MRLKLTLSTLLLYSNKQVLLIFGKLIKSPNSYIIFSYYRESILIVVKMLLVTLLYSVRLSGFQLFRWEFVICFNIEFLLKSSKQDFDEHFIELTYGACAMWPMYTSIEYVVTHIRNQKLIFSLGLKFYTIRAKWCLWKISFRLHHLL